MSDYLLKSQIITPSPYTTDDKQTIVDWSFPSTQYENLTLGASGATYTFPEDGYVGIFCTFSVVTWFDLYLYEFLGSGGSTVSAGDSRRMFVAGKKGATYGIYYNNTPTVTVFRFYYAEGVKPS